MLRAMRPNILIIGRNDAVDPAVMALVGELPGTVSYVAPNAPPPEEQSGDDAGMLIVPDVAALSAERQHEWLAWLNDPDARRPQIVATSPVPLYPMVVKETFLEALYYRLNTILLDVQDPANVAYQRYRDA
jgi:Sigma-54 interaction domain